jgi:hypothetical protein
MLDNMEKLSYNIAKFSTEQERRIKCLIKLLKIASPVAPVNRNALKEQSVKVMIFM